MQHLHPDGDSPERRPRAPWARRRFLGGACAPLILAQRHNSYRTALIGCGWWGKNIVTCGAIESGECQVVAVCDVDASMRQGTAEKVSQLTGSQPRQYPRLPRPAGAREAGNRHRCHPRSLACAPGHRGAARRRPRLRGEAHCAHHRGRSRHGARRPCGQPRGAGGDAPALLCPLYFPPTACSRRVNSAASA